MYDFAGKSFDDMTVAELRAYLAQPEITPHVTSTVNSKTRKPELILIASAAHRAFHDSGDADRTRVAEFATDGESVAEYVADMPAEPAQGLNQDRSERAKLTLLSHQGHAEPLSYSKRLANYGGDVTKLTPKQRRRLDKKATRSAAVKVRLSGGYATTERV